MSKLPIPAASYHPVPLAGALPQGFGLQDPRKLAKGAIVEMLDDAPRRTFGQRQARPPEAAFEPPPRQSHRFAGARPDPAYHSFSDQTGPSAAFLAQLIGQSLETLTAGAGLSEPEEHGQAHSAYRRAERDFEIQATSGERLNFAV